MHDQERWRDEVVLRACPHESCHCLVTTEPREDGGGGVGCFTGGSSEPWAGLLWIPWGTTTSLHPQGQHHGAGTTGYQRMTLNSYLTPYIKIN